MSIFLMHQLKREIDRLFDEVFHGFHSVLRGSFEWPEITPIMLTPSHEIKDCNDSYVLCVEVYRCRVLLPDFRDIE